MSLRKVLKKAREIGLVGLAITDHNTLEGSLQAQKLARDREDYKNLVVIPGLEVSTNYGDILGFFVQEEIRTHDAFEVIELIREQGGISVIVHPFKRLKSYPRDLLREVDGIEVFNARNSLKNSLQALKLAREFQLIMTAGSDAHFYFEIGRGCIALPKIMPCDAEEVRRCIIRREVTILGSVTSPCVEILSQLIRFMKLKDPRILLLNVCLEPARYLYRALTGGTPCRDW